MKDMTEAELNRWRIESKKASDDHYANLYRVCAVSISRTPKTMLKRKDMWKELADNICAEEHIMSKGVTAEKLRERFMADKAQIRFHPDVRTPRIIGYGAFWDAPEGWVELGKIWVDSQYRRQGIGCNLLGNLELRLGIYKDPKKVFFLTEIISPRFSPGCAMFTEVVDWNKSPVWRKILNLEKRHKDVVKGKLFVYVYSAPVYRGAYGSCRNPYGRRPKRGHRAC